MRFREVEVPDELVEAATEGKLVLFVEAGASLDEPAGLPDFANLVRDVGARANTVPTDRDLERPDVFWVTLLTSRLTFTRWSRTQSTSRAASRVTRATLLKKRVMPWLVANGNTSRGAKCALVDHPISEVRQELHRWVTTKSDDAGSATNAYSERLRSTYTDPNLSWGDAAVPDDTAWITDAIALLTVDTPTRRHGLPILDVALALGKTEDEVRELVKPQKRSGGFTRPVYLVYADRAKTHVKAIPCPHDRCRGRRFADHVSLLPEVAASGYGGICSHCRRTPAEDGAWPETQYPATYLGRWTSAGVRGSLREAPRTIRSAR